MSKIKMYPVNFVIMQIQIQTKEGMNEYKQYRKRFFMESANRVGGALTRLMQSKGECKKLSESGLAGLMDKPCTVAYSLRGRQDEKQYTKSCKSNHPENLSATK